jgi:hypothetical protein
MAHVRLAAALVVAVLAAGAALTGTARAEFFGCNDRPGKVLSDSSWHSRTTRPATRYSGIFSTQPRQRVIYSSAPRYTHYR